MEEKTISTEKQLLDFRFEIRVLMLRNEVSLDEMSKTLGLKRPQNVGYWITKAKKITESFANELVQAVDPEMRVSIGDEKVTIINKF